MAKRKYPSELNTRSIRVNIGDYHLLMELARQHDTTVAKVLHLAIIGTAEQGSVTRVSPAQIPMPVFRVTGIPVSQVAAGMIPQSAIATNGSKAAAFRIKTKGVRYA